MRHVLKLGNQRFLIWLAILVPLLITLTVIGLVCNDCQYRIEEVE